MIRFYYYQTTNYVLIFNLKDIKELYDFTPMIDEEELLAKLTEYKLEHKALDEMIERSMASDQPINLLQMQQLKKKKLWLKDMIQQIESDLIPDDIA